MKVKDIKVIVKGKEAIRFIIDSLEKSVGNRKCQYCKETIWDDNFGGVINKKFICNKITCLVNVEKPK